MASGVEELLDMLFDMVDEAKNVPLSSDKCMIERDRALDLIDDIRAQFPVELSEANELMQQAEDRSRELKRSANDYCEDALRRTEEAVAEAYDEIKKSRSRFRAAASAALGIQPSAGGSARPMYDAAADED